KAIALASTVLDQAEREGDKAEMAMCLRIIGRSQVDLARADEGIATLERALALALGANEDRIASQIFGSLGASCVDAFRLAEAETSLRKGINFCTERDLHATRLWQTAWLARALLEQSRWDEAAAAAHAVIAEPKATVIARIAALVALGRLRARRGDPGVWSALDEARDLAAGTGPDRFHVARVEAAWLEGRDRDAARDAAGHLPLAVASQRINFAAQLVLWCRLGGDEATRRRRSPTFARSTLTRSKPPAAGRMRLMCGARWAARSIRPAPWRKATSRRNARPSPYSRRWARGRWSSGSASACARRACAACRGARAIRRANIRLG
ncbi:MAG: hypothetical protein ABIR94_20135, partial [Rubrivivax sp.]